MKFAAPFHWGWLLVGAVAALSAAIVAKDAGQFDGAVVAHNLQGVAAVFCLGAFGFFMIGGRE